MIRLSIDFEEEEQLLKFFQHLKLDGLMPEHAAVYRVAPEDLKEYQDQADTNCIVRGENERDEFERLD